jgi:hypothetical protein
VLVNPADIKKMAIITPFGLFEFLELSFDLCNAGNSFQRIIDRVLVGLPFAYVFQDDLQVASHDKRKHLHHLHLLFERLCQFGVVINREKCVLGVPSFEFLGHHVLQ